MKNTRIVFDFEKSVLEGSVTPKGKNFEFMCKILLPYAVVEDKLFINRFRKTLGVSQRQPFEDYKNGNETILYLGSIYNLTTFKRYMQDFRGYLGLPVETYFTTKTKGDIVIINTNNRLIIDEFSNKVPIPFENSYFSKFGVRKEDFKITKTIKKILSFTYGNPITIKNKKDWKIYKSLVELPKDYKKGKYTLRDKQYLS